MERTTAYRADVSTPETDAPEEQNSPTPTERAHEQCPECCGETVTRYTGAASEEVCQDCGAVVEADEIDYGKEWRQFEDGTTGDSLRRCNGGGSTVLLHDKGLGSETDVSKIGNIKGPRREHIKRVNKSVTFSDSESQLLAHALTLIQSTGDGLGMGEATIKRAAHLFREAHSDGVCRGRAVEKIVAGCLVAAARDHSEPVPRDRVAEETPYDFGQFEASPDREVQKGYSIVARELGLEIQPPRAYEYVPQMAAALSATTRQKSLAMKYARRTESITTFQTSGFAPSTVATGCLFAAAEAMGSDPVIERFAEPDVTPAPATISNIIEVLEDNTVGPHTSEPTEQTGDESVVTGSSAGATTSEAPDNDSTTETINTPQTASTPSTAGHTGEEDQTDGSSQQRSQSETSIQSRLVTTSFRTAGSGSGGSGETSPEDPPDSSRCRGRVIGPPATEASAKNDPSIDCDSILFLSRPTAKTNNPVGSGKTDEKTLGPKSDPPPGEPDTRQVTLTAY